VWELYLGTTIEVVNHQSVYFMTLYNSAVCIHGRVKASLVSFYAKVTEGILCNEGCVRWSSKRT
jgi:hypothetical protein